MGLSLEENIERYGGKHGGLLYVRENVAGGGQIVPPFELLEPGQGYSWATRRAVLAACKETKAQGVIVRTSERSDWKGMVDTMPTVVTSDWSLSIMRAISMVRRRCEDEQLLKYAERERNGYDPGRVTVSIAPYFPPSEDSPRTLITQHLTMSGAHLADVLWPAEMYPNDGHFANRSFDYDGDDNLHYYYHGDAHQDEARRTLDMVRDLENERMLPDTEAFQFEGGFHGRQPRLFQIRHFADKRHADFQINNDRPQFLRDFGVTPREGIELEVVRLGTRDAFAHFEAKNPGVKYLLVVDEATEKLAISDQPMDMNGYIPKNAPALSHQATRLVQIALRHPHGVSSLYLPPYRVNGLKHGRKVRIIADGIRQSIEILR